MDTSRIFLRPWRDSDAAALYKYASDPEVGPRAGWPPHQSEDESLEIIRTVFNNDTTWAIVLKETGEAIGAMGYGSSCECKLPARPDEPTVGYWVGKPYWNKGICTEALALLIGMGFEYKNGRFMNYFSYYDNATKFTFLGTDTKSNRLYFGTLKSGERVFYDNTNVLVQGREPLTYILSEIRRNK